MPSSKQRLEVWRGTRETTSGGLRKKDLVKNSRGKIVSRKKSTQAAAQNNLGNYLRDAGKSIPKDKMLQPKKKKLAPKKVKTLTKPKQTVSKKPAVKKPKLAAPKKPAPKKVKTLTNAPKKKAAAKKAAAPKKSKPGINPLTQQPYARAAKTDKSGLHLDNIKRYSRRSQEPALPEYFGEDNFG